MPDLCLPKKAQLARRACKHAYLYVSNSKRDACLYPFDIREEKLHRTRPRPYTFEDKIKCRGRDLHPTELTFGRVRSNDVARRCRPSAGRPAAASHAPRVQRRTKHAISGPPLPLSVQTTVAARQTEIPSLFVHRAVRSCLRNDVRRRQG